MSAGRRPTQSHPAYLLLGEDLYLRDRLREEILDANVPVDAREFAVARYALDRTPLEEVLRRATILPMFAPRQVLLLSRVEKLPEEDLPHLKRYFDAPAEFTVLVFEAAKLDRRTRVARLLLERCQVQEADSPDDTGALAAAQQFAHDLGLRITRETAEDLVLALGNDLGLLRRELEKLRTYVGDRKEVTSADVAALVSPARRFSVFDLADPLAERRRAQVLLLLRRLLEAGESPVGIVGMLAWLYRQLLQAQALPRSAPAWQAAKVLRAPRTRIEPLLRQARKFRREDLQEAFVLLNEADVTLKSSPPDPVAVLETLVVRLTGPAQVGRGA